jgi:hypothetical protein
MEIKYHTKYEVEAKELETFLEGCSWDENHEVISVDDAGNLTDTLDVQMTESEEDVYDVKCEGTTVSSNPTSVEEVGEAIIDQAKVWGSPTIGDPDFEAKDPDEE